MKVKFVGQKKLLSVSLPIGNSGKPVGTLDFTSGQVIEMSDEDGKKLIEIGQGKFVDADAKDKPIFMPEETQESAPVDALVEEEAPKRRGRPPKAKVE